MEKFLYLEMGLYFCAVFERQDYYGFIINNK